MTRRLFTIMPDRRRLLAFRAHSTQVKKPITETSESEYDDMSAVNAKSAFFFMKEARKHLNDNGKLVTLVTSLPGAFTPFYSSCAGTKAPLPVRPLQ